MLRALLVCVIVATAHGYAVARPLLHGVVQPVSQLRCTARYASPACSAVMAEDGAAEEPPPPLFSKAFFQKWAKFDKDTIKKLGFDAFFTYGVVSNANVAVLVGLAWATFSRASGLSPLAPGQWKGFVGTYAALYLSLGSILRPIRFAVAVGATPVYTAFVEQIRATLPWKQTRPKLNRTLAIISVSLLFNVFGTFFLMFLGVSLAGLVTGVAPFPPGWRFGH